MEVFPADARTVDVALDVCDAIELCFIDLPKILGDRKLGAAHAQMLKYAAGRFRASVTALVITSQQMYPMERLKVYFIGGIQYLRSQFEARYGAGDPLIASLQEIEDSVANTFW